MQNKYNALILVTLTTAFSIAATCPTPTEFGPCGIQNSDATVANSCVATTGGYYTDKEKKCAGNNANKGCNNNLQTGTANITYYKLVTAYEPPGSTNIVSFCTDELTGAIPNPATRPYSCGKATLNSSTCIEGS